MDRTYPDEAPRALRRDAANNRKSILRAAASILADRGCDVDVREIARCAGVGMGTLYRHFPTKEQLLETVLHETFQEWEQAALEIKDREPDSWLALQNFMADSVRRQADHQALLETLAGSLGRDAALNACTMSIRPTLTSMVRGAHASGDLRPDVTVDDIFALLIALGRIVEFTPALPGADYQKYVGIVIDGLVAGDTQ